MKRKTTVKHPETRINPVQVFHLDSKDLRASAAVNQFIDYRLEHNDPVSIQQAMRLLVIMGWASIAAAQTAEEQGK